MDETLNAKDSIININKPQTIADVAVTLLTLKPLQEKKYDQFCELILVASDSNTSS